MSLAKQLALFGYDAASAPFGVSCAQQDAAFPATRLMNVDLFNSFRSALGTLTGVQIVIQLPAAINIQGVMLHGTNLSLTAQAKVELTLSDNTFAGGNIIAGSDTSFLNCFDSSRLGVDPYWPPWGWTFLRLFSSPIGPAQWIRISINDSANAYNYIGASVVRCGALWQPTTNIEATTWDKNDDIRGELGFQKVCRGHMVTFHRLTWSDEASLFSISRNLKQTGRLMLVPQPNDTSTWLNDAIWGVFEPGTGGTGTGNSLHSSPLTTLATLKTCQVGFREVDR